MKNFERILKNRVRNVVWISKIEDFLKKSMAMITLKQNIHRRIK
jgi:hypothetical protein